MCVKKEEGVSSIKKKYSYFLALIVVGILVFSFLRWDDYREKDLVEVLDAEEIVEFRYTDRTEDYSTDTYNGIVKDQEPLQELATFFSQYRVKKEGGRDFDMKYPVEQFTFHIFYEDDRITIPSLIERDVFLFDMDRYKIVNGPVDYAWLEDFMERQK